MRLVAPTPPRGVPGFKGPPESVRARPPAPDFDFSGRLQQPTAGMRCGRCGTENPLDSAFCAECGTRVAEPPASPLQGAPVVGAAARPAEVPDVVCGRCSGRNRPHMAYCQYCGAKLASDAPDSTRPEVPVAKAPSLPSPVAPHPPDLARPAVVAPAPVPAASAGRSRLVVIAQDGSPGREYALGQDQTDIGHDQGAIQLPNDPYVSPRHARVVRRGGRFFILDLGSVNGVYLRLRKPHALVDGDLVLVGLEVLRFDVVSAAEKGFGPAMELGTQVFGSPAMPRLARLCQRTVEGVTRDVHYLTREETVLGRESGDIVFTADPFMSRKHAAITRDGASGGFSLRDLGSSNGTYVALRGEHPLTAGDHVRVGQHLFRIDIDASAGQP